jgi:gentisate 1,2-dioxygenase
MDHAPARTPEREAFYKTIDGAQMTPLWEVLAGLVTKEPVSPCKPHLWRYAEVRPHVMRAGEIITAKEAERRVLVLENPGLRGQSRITHSLYAGLQLIKPGEVAPAHRHMASALRFIIEGKGAYTAVDGEKTIMSEGDFVITPPWTWHDHGNDSDRPMVWLDGLDVPLVNTFDASFAENFPKDEQPLARPAGASPARYGGNVVPVDYKKGGKCSPIFNYPYERTRATLETMRKFEAWDPCHGLKVRYVDPTSGDFAMPTIGTFMQLLPKGFKSVPYRSTDGMVYSPVEGRGRTIVAGVAFEWGPKDVFVVPSWAPHHHEADADAVLFSFSDRPAQQKLGLWREQRGNEPVSAPN